MSQHARPQGDDASYRGIWRLTWPQMLMMVFHFLIGFTDVWVAGRIQPEVQAAIGLVSQCLFFLLVVAVAGANAGVAAISQALGAGLLPRARRYAGMVLAGGCTVGVGIMLLGLATIEPFLRLLQVPEPIMPVASYFWKVYLLGLPANYLFTITGAVFRARKRMIAPLVSMVVVCIVNAGATLGFGLGLWGLPAYGYAGVAWATFVAIMIGAALNVGMLVRDRELLQRASFPPLRWMRRGAPYLIRVAAPAAGLQIMWNLGYLVLFSITASLPAGSVAALAGMTAGMRVESFIFLPALAFNMTASVLVGHLLGAGRKPEAFRVSLRLLGGPGTRRGRPGGQLSALQPRLHPLHRGQHDPWRGHDRRGRHPVFLPGVRFGHVVRAAAAGMGHGPRGVAGCGGDLSRHVRFPGVPVFGHAVAVLHA